MPERLSIEERYKRKILDDIAVVQNSAEYNAVLKLRQKFGLYEQYPDQPAKIKVELDYGYLLLVKLNPLNAVTPLGLTLRDLPRIILGENQGQLTLESEGLADLRTIIVFGSCFGGSDLYRYASGEHISNHDFQTFEEGARYYSSNLEKYIGLGMDLKHTNVRISFDKHIPDYKTFRESPHLPNYVRYCDLETRYLKRKDFHHPAWQLGSYMPPKTETDWYLVLEILHQYMDRKD